ncbi:MAG: potassium uptake system protein [Bdellovibrionaceae bacterium]|nr:potassium uptake system protein [Pseudobdellovibrionaceae bacterium]|tara:strand:+ start:151 stop:837 length:687 start_codon:yes stop_codon:yes gene_type:complete
MARKQFLIIGMGILGQSVAKTLSSEGAEVIAVDQSPLLVDQVKDFVEVAVQVDATDKKALEQLGVNKVDAAIVCIGEDFNSAILTVANLIDLGVNHVKARANAEMEHKILSRIGADEVFFVEIEMGKNIAHKLAEPTVVDEMDVCNGYKIVQWVSHQKMAGHTLQELALPTKHRVYVVGIRKTVDGKSHVEPATRETKIDEGDLLILSGHEKDLSLFLQSWKKGSPNG